MINTFLKKPLTTSSSSFLFLSSLILSFFVQITKQDNPCPFPCYPPPTGTNGGGTGTGTVTPTPPDSTYSPPSQTGGVYPPPGTSNPTPTGNLPYIPPPPYDGNSLYGRPPPDPILPYFPYYYRKPPHKTDDGDLSSATTITSPRKSLINMIATINLLVFIFLVISSLED